MAQKVKGVSGGVSKEVSGGSSGPPKKSQKKSSEDSSSQKSSVFMTLETFQFGIILHNRTVHTVILVLELRVDYTAKIVVYLVS